MRSRHLFSFFVTVLVLVTGGGCASRGPKRIAVAPPPPPPPPALALSETLPLHRLPRLPNLQMSPQPEFDPIQDVIARAEEAFLRGQQNYYTGHLEMAKKEFNSATEALLRGPVPPNQDKRLQKAFDSLVDRIHTYEVQALKQGDGFTEPVFQPAPLDELQTLTFPEDSQLSRQVEAEAARTVSDIPLVTNPQVASYIGYFTSGRGRATLEATWARAGRYRDMILRILEQEKVPQELLYLAQAESGFQSRARSRAGALGLWQFMPSRGSEYGLRRDWWVDERLNPEKATQAAARHLRDLYNTFGDWYLALAAYNCGPQCVQRAIERTGYADFWELSRRRVLPAETRNYVPIIVALTIIGKNAEKYGLEDLLPEPPRQYDTVTVTTPVDLRLVAEMVDTSVETIRELNPHVLRMTTPKVPEYPLQIPLATRDVFLRRIEMVPPEKRVFWRWHTVRYGETLTGIAKQFKTTVKAIAEVNNLAPEEPLQEAAELVIPVTSPAPAPLAAGQGDRHQVRRGDTLASIARRYNVTAAQLMAWNNLDSTLIRAGSTLLIRPTMLSEPADAAPSTAASRSASRPATVVATSVLVNQQGLPIRTASANGNGNSSEGSVVHRVRKGESLSQIASSYNTSVEALKKNNRHLRTVLQIGDRVVIPSPD